MPNQNLVCVFATVRPRHPPAQFLAEPPRELLGQHLPGAVCVSRDDEFLDRLKLLLAVGEGGKAFVVRVGLVLQFGRRTIGQGDGARVSAFDDREHVQLAFDEYRHVVADQAADVVERFRGVLVLPEVLPGRPVFMIEDLAAARVREGDARLLLVGLRELLSRSKDVGLVDGFT